MKTITVNKKAYFNYFISDETETGIILEGSEVKSIRNGHISIAESFVQIKDGEVFLKNAYIKPYDKSGAFTPDSRKNRKLLLNKSEIIKFQKQLDTKGFTLVPLKVYFSNRNKVKVLIGLGKGKKLYDKREVLKEKAINRETAREILNNT